LFKLKKTNLLAELIKAYFFVITKVLKGKKVVCLDIYEKGYIEHVVDFLSILNEISQVSIILTTQDCYLKDLKILSLRHKLISFRILKILYGISLFITPQVNLKNPPGSYSIHIFHNQPVKYLSFPPQLLKLINEHFVWGNFMEFWVKKMLISHKINGKISRIGSPRHDKEIFNRKPEKNLSYTLNEKIFTIGYAPSWDPNLSLRSNGLKIIKTIAALEKVSIFIRLHPCSLLSRENIDFNFYTGGINWHREISNMKIPNLSFHQEESTIEYINSIDLLITDISSISYEAFLSNKPVIFYEIPKYWETRKDLYETYRYSDNAEDYKEIRNNPNLNGGREAGLVANSLEELKQHILKIYNGDDKCSQLRQNMVKNLL